MNLDFIKTTDQEKAKAYLPLVQALAEGKTLEYIYKDKWTDLSTTGALRLFGFTNPPDDYRVKVVPREVVLCEGSDGSIIFDFNVKDGTRYQAPAHWLRNYRPIRFREVIEEPVV